MDDVLADKQPEGELSDAAFVYAVRAKRGPTSPVKFGIAVDVARRVRFLQSGNPRPLAVLVIVQGGRDLERSIHNLLRPFRTNGEWFHSGDKFITDFARQLNKFHGWRDSIRRIGSLPPHLIKFLANDYGKTRADFARFLLNNAVGVAWRIEGWRELLAALPLPLPHANGGRQ